MADVVINQVNNNDSGYESRKKINENNRDIVNAVNANYTDLSQKINAVGLNEIPKPAVPSFSELEIQYPNPEIGWTSYVTGTKTKYKWNGEQWVVVSQDNMNSLSQEDVQLELGNTEKPISQGIVTKEFENKADKSDLPLAYNNIEVDVILGYYVPTTGAYRGDNGHYSCAKIDLSVVGRNIALTGTVDTPSIALVVYMDAENKFISNEFQGTSEIPVQYVKQLLTIPYNAAFALITATNNRQPTTPVIGVHSYSVGDILTSEKAKENFVTNEAYLSSTKDAPQKFARLDVIKENGFINPDGSIGSQIIGYKRGIIDITPDNFNKLYYTGAIRSGGAIIAAYLNEAGIVVKTEAVLQESEYKFWKRYKLEMPEGTKSIRVSGQYDFSAVGQNIKALDFFIEQFVGVDYEAITDRQNSIIELNRNNTKIVAEIPGTTINTYANRWFVNNLRIKTAKTFDTINIPIVRRGYGDDSSLFTDGLIVSVVTSTGYAKKIEIPFSEIEKYNLLTSTDSMDKFIYSIFLNDAITVDEDDIVQITTYCKSANDKIAIFVEYISNNAELKDTEFFDIETNGFYEQDGNTELADNELLNIVPIRVNLAWINYCAIALSTILPKDKSRLEKVYPDAIYTVANDINKSEVLANTRNYAALLQLDHFLNGLTSEPTGMCFDNGRTDMVIMSPVSGAGGTDNAPIFNENQTILETTKNIVIKGGEKYKDDAFAVKHRSTLASASANKLPKVLICGDSISSSMPKTPYDLQNGSYFLHTKEMFFKDWVDAGQPVGQHQALFLGLNCSYMQFYEGWKRVKRSIEYKGVQGEVYADKIATPGANTDMLLTDYINFPNDPTNKNNIYLTKDGKFSIKTILEHHRTTDDNGVRLPNDSPEKGVNVGDVNDYDMCVPNIILFGFGANDNPNSTSWLDNQKAIIASIKAEYAANNWGRVFIGIMQPSQAGTYFPSLHPNLPNELMFWDKTQHGATEGRHDRLWKFYQQWKTDGTYTEADDVYCVPFFFTAPVDVPMNRLITLPDGTPIVGPSTGLPFTHVNAIAHQHWGYQLYSWIKYVMSL